MITYYYCQCGEKVVTNQARNQGWLIIRMRGRNGSRTVIPECPKCKRETEEALGLHVPEVPNVPKSLNI